MATIFWILIAAGLVIAALMLLFKLYMVMTTGRYKIKKSLKGKVVVITGGTAGIGKETVRELAKHGATVHILARNLQKAEDVVQEINESIDDKDLLHIHQADLSDFSTVRAFAKKFLDTKSPIHILINNAGLIQPVKKETVDGNEVTTQANHLGHFLLTNLLLDRIIQSAPSRIVNVSSEGHRLPKQFDPYDINYKKQSNKWSSLGSYCWSKLMNVLFTRELARRLYGTGVTTNVLHPGAVRTDILSGTTWKEPLSLLFILFRPFFKTSLEGAQTTLYLAVSEEVENISGHYFADCKLTSTTLLAADDRLASELWMESEKLTGLEKEKHTIWVRG